MLLQRLAELYERHGSEMIPPHHKPNEIQWLIRISPEGSFEGFVSTRGDEGALKKPRPYRRRQGSSPPPYLLVDTPAYVLGLGLGKMNDTKAQRRNEAFVELTRECAEACDLPETRAVVRFLQTQVQEAREARPDGMKPGDLITFQVGDRLPFETDSVRKFWIRKMEAHGSEASHRTGRCLLCNRVRPIAARHPVELQIGPDRVQLISANDNAFESYGLKASEVAPLCTECAGKYGRALRYLLDSDRHSMPMANTTHVFWTREPEEFDPWNLLMNPTPEEVQRLLQAAYRAGGVPEIEPGDFYALSVSAYTSRMVVREWLETTVPRVRRNLAAYFEAQRMVGPGGEDSPYPLRTLTASLSRDFRGVTPQAETALLAFAIRGSPVPTWVLHQAVQRARADADRRMTRPRAALMRLTMESQRLHGLSKEEDIVKAELDTHKRSPAYLCGRLLAVLEEIQRAALPGIKATLVDKYFGTASSAPATVFGTLMRTAQSHMAKLRKEKRGAFLALDQRMQEICGTLDAFPRTLSLQDQALFSLGYYQQKAADRPPRRVEQEAETPSEQ